MYACMIVCMHNIIMLTITRIAHIQFTNLTLAYDRPDVRTFGTFMVMEGQTHRQPNKQTSIQTDRQADRTGGQNRRAGIRNRKACKHADRQTNRQGDGQTDLQARRRTDRLQIYNVGLDHIGSHTEKQTVLRLVLCVCVCLLLHAFSLLICVYTLRGAISYITHINYT